MLSGHESGARGGRYGRAAVGLGEHHALLGEFVNVRSGNELLTIASQVAIAHVVTHHVDNVGALIGLIVSVLSLS